jgi:hypothetical protein
MLGGILLSVTVPNIMVPKEGNINAFQLSLASFDFRQNQTTKNETAHIE